MYVIISCIFNEMIFTEHNEINLSDVVMDIAVDNEQIRDISVRVWI